VRADLLSDSAMSATLENNPDLGLPSDSALSGVDRSNVAVPQGFDTPHGTLSRYSHCGSQDLEGNFRALPAETT
jgi:hypothetical protein